MTLNEFLLDKTLTAVEIAEDFGLIFNIYIGEVGYGLDIDISNVPYGTSLSIREDFTLEKILTTDWETVGPVRAKYSVFYVQHTHKRIKDLDWLLLNKSKFKKYSNSQVFNLIKLKEKLSIDNSCPF